MRLALRATAGAAIAAGLVAALTVGTVAAAGSTSTAAPRAADSAGCARPAEGAGSDSIGNLRRFGDCEIDRRLVVLGRLAGRVTASASLSPAHRTALSNQVGATAAGLRALRSTIDAETSPTVLKAEIEKIATDFRVYLLVVPKSALVIAADRLTSGYARFEVVEQRLVDAIARAKAAGKDVVAAQASCDAMIDKVDRADGLLDPVVGTILMLTPSDWNAGTAKPAIQSARSTLREVGRLFAGARTDARACAKALRALR